MEMKTQVLQSGYYLFDNKPLIYKEWTKDLDLKKEVIQSVPVWVKLNQLPLKFWGKSLPKISGLLGNFFKCDTATEQKTRLDFARVMLELKVDQHCPEEIRFKDEMGEVVRIGIDYEWKPITCSKCNGMGHQQTECRKGTVQKRTMLVQKVWRPVQKEGKKDGGQHISNTEQNQTNDPTPQAVSNQLSPQPVLNKFSPQQEDRGGYSGRVFGSQSYRDALSPKRTGDKTEEHGTPLNLAHG
ncbi:hypothetical protein vseg_011768 [Gypsophila vaccaria]